MLKCNRRVFVLCTGLFGATLSAASSATVNARYRVGVIGHTGLDGEIGRVLEYRMRGKEDTRGGLLDLWVLGSHLVNLLNYFAGNPTSCAATVLIDGRPASKADAIPGGRRNRTHCGQRSSCSIRDENGIMAHFDSIAKAGSDTAGFGLQIIGTKGVIDFRVDREPLAQILHGIPSFR